MKEVNLMPNIKSAKKRILVSKRRNEENTLVKSSMKTAIKNVEKAVKAKESDKAKENLKVANTRIDKAVNTGVVKKNKAARLKSRLTKMTNNME